MRSTLVHRSVLTAAAPRLFTPATPLLCRLTHRGTSALRLAYTGAGRPSLRSYSSATNWRPHNVIHKSIFSYIASRQLGGTGVNKISSITGIRKSSTAAMENGTGQNGTASGATKPVLFFDIDNCLYSRSTRVHDRMAVLIDEYFAKHLDLPAEEAKRLHGEYYTMYGLAIEGLVRHHEIDPLDYNAKVDDALPLEDIIKPDPALREMLEDIDKDKVTMWLFTNAYVTHGRRVVKLLGIEDLFDGLTYCDYAEMPLVCKPSEEMYKKAMRHAGVSKFEDCYFVDDSFMNCAKAQELGWTAAHLVEEGFPIPKKQASQYQIKSILELRDIYPQFFKSKNPAQN